ncbi:PRMT3 [Lepeophtheirus salmonis]|uniref:type I protein arginine methyltransferase n=1 Tax=Lepeophtheirus salmonis TaxID=72036 RepID=A0A7R8D0R8_LEPSM|nr:PRMT3 [Lepeophtheirus salmonis]CAF2987174.1 PRMT3 [Lepeophtheirus salmonis]
MSDCSSGGEYEENETEYFSPPCRDLYSDQMLDSATQCWTFIKEKYGLDLQVLKKRHNLDMFSYIRMVNYIRLEMPKPEDLMSLKTDEKWGDMKWMTPTVENDALLMYDVFEDEEDTVIEPEIENGTSEHEAISISYKEYRALRRFKEEYEPMMESYKEQTRRMTEITQRLVQDTSFNNSKAIQNEEEQLCAPVSSLLLEKEDQNYATSYSHFSIHHEMLSDQIRTNSYKNAIESNANSLIKSKDILDLGCGTGILSLFCAQAGAKSVTAVDMSDVINLAIDIAHENGLQDTISFRKGRLEDISLTLMKRMLDSVVDARNKYLKPDTGRLLPNRCTLYYPLCAIWIVLKEASVEVVPKDKIISESPAEILNLDLEKCSVKDYSSFTSNFELKASENGHITAICGYFDTFFELPENKVFFTTGPQGHQTHWKQTLFYMKSPLQVNKGDIIKGHISVRRPKRDPRGLIVTLKVMGTEQKYVID